MGRVEYGRAGSLIKEYKDDGVKDITSTYFLHPIWAMKAGSPIPDMPLDVQFELLNRCNLQCIDCSARMPTTRARSLLEWEVLRKCVDEAASEGVCYFTICGIGEASLHPDLWRLCGYIRSKDVEQKGLRVLPMMPTILVSNGMYSKAQVEECIKNPPDVLSISVAGLTDEEIERRRSPLQIDRLWQNIWTIYKGRKVVRGVDGSLVPIIHVSTHILPREYSERAEDIRAFKKRWFEVSDAVVIKPRMIGKFTESYGEFLVNAVSRSEGDGPLCYADISQTHFQRIAPCFETSRRLSIDSDGNVWCGHHRSEDFGRFLGNVKWQSLREIWHGEPMNEFRRQVRAGAFERRCCMTCGDEIREVQRERAERVEDNLRFLPSAV